MSGIDEGDVLILQQQLAINRVKDLLNKVNLSNITDAEIMGALEKTKKDSGEYDPDYPYGEYDPDKAYNILRNDNILRNELAKSKTRKKLDDVKNAAKKIGDSNNNKTRKNRIRTEINKAQEYGEKQDLESKLPDYLKGANVDIIERDNHCFFVQ